MIARPAARPGMSLLEVLLASAIFLMALASIAQLVDQGADRGSDIVRQNLGTRLAQSKLAEVEAGVISASGGGSGTFDEEPGWQWSVEPGAAAAPNVYPVTVRAWRENGSARFEVSLSAMVYDPLQLGHAAAATAPTEAAATTMAEAAP